MKKECSGIIYKATFSNSKCYIGQTTGKLNYRRKSHINSKDSENVVFHNAINKYGEDDISWEIIDTATSIEELNNKEMYWINFYNSYIHSKNSNGYNMTLGGNSTLGWIPSEETKEKIGNSNQGKLSGEKNPQYGKTKELSQWWGRKHTEEEKEKISIANKGRIFTEEHCRKISNSLKGKMNGVPKTKEHKNNISIAKMGHTVSNETRIKISLKNRGENNFWAKLSETQVIEIIQKLINGQSNKLLAQEYNVSIEIIYAIKNNRTWKHVLPDIRHLLIKKNKRNHKNGN